MIDPKCDKCGKELEKQGALLFSPPDEKNRTEKYHICDECYGQIKYFITEIPDYVKVFVADKKPYLKDRIFEVKGVEGKQYILKRFFEYDDIKVDKNNCVPSTIEEFEECWTISSDYIRNSSGKVYKVIEKYLGGGKIELQDGRQATFDITSVGTATEEDFNEYWKPKEPEYLDSYKWRDYQYSELYDESGVQVTLLCMDVGKSEEYLVEGPEGDFIYRDYLYLTDPAEWLKFQGKNHGM